MNELLVKITYRDLTIQELESHLMDMMGRSDAKIFSVQRIAEGKSQ